MTTYAMTSDSTFSVRLRDLLGLFLTIICIGLMLFFSQLWSVGGFGAWGVSYGVASVMFVAFWFLGRITSDEPVADSNTAIFFGKHMSGALAVLGMYGSLSCMLGVWLSVMPRPVSIFVMGALAVAWTALVAIFVAKMMSASFFEGRSSLGYTMAAAVIGWNAFYSESLTTLMDLHPRGSTNFIGGVLVGILAACVTMYVMHQVSSGHPEGTASLFSIMRTPLNLFGLGVRRNSVDGVGSGRDAG